MRKYDNYYIPFIYFLIFYWCSGRRELQGLQGFDVKGYNKMMKWKTLRKNSLHEKTAASVLLKLFISSNE